MSNAYEYNNLNEITNKLLKIFCTQSYNYTVQRGDFYKVDIFELCNQGLVPSCFGNDIDNPYFSCAIEPSANQTAQNFVEVEKCKYLSFRLGFNEAIVMIGRTPPEVKYFSYGVYVTSRYSEHQNEATERYKVIPLRNKPIRYEIKSIHRNIVYGCLGEPLNNLKINTPGTPKGAPGYPYNQPVLIVFTANQDIQKDIYTFATSVGFSPDSLNVVTIPIDIVNLGVTNQKTDTFTIINRIVGQDKDNKKLQQYLNCPGMNVFKVTSSSNKKGSSQPIPFLTPRGTGRTELQYSKPVEDLHNKIIDCYMNEYDSVEILTDIWLDESYLAIQQGLNNLEEARDVVYFGSAAFQLPKDAFIVVFGVNHVKTGKCAYSNIAVYGNEYDNGVVEVNNAEYVNSAAEYITDPVSDYLYAWRFGYYKDYSCNYSQIPTYNPDNDLCKNSRHTREINPREDIYIGCKAYLEAATKVGPYYSELILDRVVLFLKKEQSC